MYCLMYLELKPMCFLSNYSQYLNLTFLMCMKMVYALTAWKCVTHDAICLYFGPEAIYYRINNLNQSLSRRRKNRNVTKTITVIKVCPATGLTGCALSLSFRGVTSL